MKKVLTTLLAIVTFATLYAQAPQGFNYQATVRNAAGQLMTNRTVGVRISILQGSSVGTIIYQQEAPVNTNANGLFTLIVGDNSADFANINWANGPYYIHSEIDLAGGTNYTLSTTQKILAVPYALYANLAGKAESVSDDWTYNEHDPYFRDWGYLYDSLRNVPTNLSQFNNDVHYLTAGDLLLTLHGDTLFINGGSYVILPFNMRGTIEWDSVLNHPTHLSQFINDLGFITDETQGLNDVIAINNNAYNQIKNVYAPTDPLDAVNKAYMDSALAAEVAALNARIDSLNNRLDSLNATYNYYFDSVNNRIYQLEHPRINGALPGIFSVGANTRINFSQGNLQYRPRIKTWRFAVNQYDVAGSANNNVYMQAYCSDWIDLFGYGTSGWDGGAGRFMPYETTTNNTEYTEDPNGNDLTGFYANADWGYYNPIINGGNQTALWRTLTSTEWTYLLTQRTNAEQLKGMATVENTPGYVILPDTWVCPTGLTFVNSNSSYTDNVYSAANWAIMEAAGAVFLPAAGQRSSSNTTNVGTIGNYWSTSHVNGTTGYTFHIAPNANQMDNTVTYSTGCSVRLVREY
ncbi:MAG: hypothetical protein IJK84_06330 [Bacteroidales bacterium]|nr:hypothetical protein [Bacteroidales bacterium]